MERFLLASDYRWMTGRCSLLIFVLCLSFHVNESKPLSSSGCACKSGCDKSWLSSVAKLPAAITQSFSAKLPAANQVGSAIEWCYVDTQCKAAGWDTCHDTEVLYRSAVNEKQLAQQERKDAQQRSAALEKRLQATKDELRGSELKTYSLQKQLEDEMVKEAKAENHYEAAERKVKDVERQAADVEHKAELKIKEIANVEHKAEVKINETEQELVKERKELMKAWSKEEETTKKLGETQQKFKEYVEDSKIKTGKMKQQLLKDAETKQNEVERKRKEAERKESEAEHEVQVKVKEMKQSMKDAASRRHNDALKLSDAELRQVGMEKKLKKTEVQAKDANTKVNSLVKAMAQLKATSEEKLAVVNRKLAETEKKLEIAELVGKASSGRLKEVETQQAQTKKELQVSEKKRRQADAELKPFRSAIRGAVRSLAAEALHTDHTPVYH